MSAGPLRGGGSPTTGLLLGLVITLAAVVAYSTYIVRQITRLRTLQTELADRSRRDSLQLLRIQNSLHSLGLAMRDMLDAEEPYPLIAWSAQFERIRTDLEDALTREEELAPGNRTGDQRRYLASSLAQFWDASDRIFARAKAGDEAEARAQIRVSLQARQASLTSAVARLLVENNAAEEQAALRTREIYAAVERQVYWFLAGTLTTIVITSAYLIRSNRLLFAELASLSNQRRELAQNLIAARESTFRQISRELHDEFGQILTAIGSILNRAGRHVPEDSPLREDLREVAGIAQATLDKVRSLSQTLHPSILDELGLESTIEWYLSTAGKQLGLDVSYEASGRADGVDPTIAIHVYRVLQEALTNVAKHSGSTRAWVRLQVEPDRLQLDVEDHGRGLDPAARARGLGIVTMRERAELVSGTIELLKPREGGVIVRLRVPAGGSAGGQARGRE